jgi:hypothetical protein
MDGACCRGLLQRGRSSRNRKNRKRKSGKRKTRNRKTRYRKGRNRKGRKSNSRKSDSKRRKVHWRYLTGPKTVRWRLDEYKLYLRSYQDDARIRAQVRWGRYQGYYLGPALQDTGGNAREDVTVTGTFR